MDANATHVVKIDRIANELRSRDAKAGPLSLQKGGVSHFVPNPNDPKHRDRKINVRDLNEILEIDPGAKTCTAEPGVTFERLVRETLKRGLAPMLVPELKTITIGGAVSGCSVESMSHKYGGFHDSCLEYEVITAAGDVLSCSPSANADVFHMIHGSYGTLGIISKLKFRLIDAKPFVRMDYVTYKTFGDLTKGVLEQTDADFIDAIVHSPDRNVLCAGTFMEAPPTGVRPSDYTWLNVFYKSTREKTRDYLTTYDYFFRYDTECHWLSRTVPGLETKLLRFLLGKFLLGSTNLLTWSKRLAPLLKFDKRPDVVVDVFIPVNRLETFMRQYREKIGYYPLWVVPYRRVQPYPWIHPDYDKAIGDRMFFDLAVYGLSNRDRKANYYEILEEMTYECRGIKTLISHNFYDRGRFWTIYNRPEYERIKKRTDPDNFFRDLYDKFHFNLREASP
ncbi:MAG TPA: FAD-binding oxidoreductase [bacterium]|nr:FAD-binding oxidoreductase [bacterium]